MNKIAGLLILLVLAMSSCIKMEDISVKGVEDISVKSMSNVGMSISVENRSRRTINIEAARIKLDNGSKPVVTLQLKDRAVIQKRATTSVDMNWAVKFDNPLGALAMISSLKRSLNQMTVSGEIVVKSGWVKKKIELNAVPLSQILSTFGVQTDDIIKSLGI